MSSKILGVTYSQFCIEAVVDGVKVDSYVESKEEAEVLKRLYFKYCCVEK